MECNEKVNLRGLPAVGKLCLNAPERGWKGKLAAASIERACCKQSQLANMGTRDRQHVFN